MLGDEFAFYTLIPRVRDPSNLSWSDSCCNGNWKVRHGNDWVTMLPTNTRVRDVDNRRWVEICQGHVVVVPDALAASAYPFDCRAYSLVADELRTTAGHGLDIAAFQDSIFSSFLGLLNGVSSFALLYVTAASRLHLHLRYGTTYKDLSLAAVSNGAALRSGLSVRATLTGVDDVYVVNCEGVKYTVILVPATGATTVTEAGSTPLSYTPLRTTNAFVLPYPSTSAFVPGTASIDGAVNAVVAGKALTWPTSSNVVAYLASTADQSYLVEVYDTEIHFAKLSLTYALSN